MTKNKRKFIIDSENVAFDIKHSNTIKFNISKYDVAFTAGLNRYHDLKRAREIAATIKRDVVKNLPHYLECFEKKATSNGIEVLWAEQPHQAVQYIKQIAREAGVTKVVKSKSMTSEELHLNEELAKEGIEPVETDLGEFIVQKAGEKPYHILTPAMHKSRQDVADLFNRLYGTSRNESAEALTGFVRNKLRDDFEEAGIGVSGANFLLAREGGIALTENEGNGLFTISYPKIHIVIAGIEKILPSAENLDLFWPLLACHGTGQQVSVYNSMVFGPKKPDEINGPERMVVILLDNGRSQLYAKEHQSEALSCIRCGACLNACPIYKNIGGYTYNAVYSGPIGSVITPHLKPFKDYNHLSFASSLCGRCYEVCPVKINLPQLLLYNRHEAVEKGLTPIAEKAGFALFGWSMQSFKRVEWLRSIAKGYVFSELMAGVFGKKRKFSGLSRSSFRNQWLKKV